MTLQVALVALSFMATLVGLADMSEVDLTESVNPFSILQAVFVVAIAAAVMLAMMFSLTTLLGNRVGLLTRALALVGYLFFVLWSIAFGYGFFWKLFAAEDFTRTQFLSQTEQIQAEVQTVVTTLRSVSDDAARAAEMAAERARTEETTGGSCENNRNSGSTRGPLTESRLAFEAASMTQADKIRDEWLVPLDEQAGQLSWKLRALNPDNTVSVFPGENRPLTEPGEADRAVLERLVADVNGTPNTRSNAYSTVQSDINSFVRNANANLQGIGVPASVEFQRLADDVSIQGERPTNRYCEDPQLAAIMQDVANDLGALQPVEQLGFRSMEGSAATRYAAFKFGDHVIARIRDFLGMGAYDEADLDPLTNDDIMALYATGAIDFALLVVSVLASQTGRDRVPSGLWLAIRRRLGFRPGADEIERETAALRRQGEAERKQQETLQDMAASKAQAQAEISSTTRGSEKQELENELARLRHEEELEAIREQIAGYKAQGEHTPPPPLKVYDRVQRYTDDFFKRFVEHCGGDEAAARALATMVSPFIEDVGGQYHFVYVRWQNAERRLQMKRLHSWMRRDPGFGTQPLAKDDPVVSTLRQRLLNTVPDDLFAQAVDVYRMSDSMAFMILGAAEDLSVASQLAAPEAPLPEAPAPYRSEFKTAAGAGAEDGLEAEPDPDFDPFEEAAPEDAEEEHSFDEPHMGGYGRPENFRNTRAEPAPARTRQAALDTLDEDPLMGMGGSPDEFGAPGGERRYTPNDPTLDPGHKDNIDLRYEDVEESDLDDPFETRARPGDEDADEVEDLGPSPSPEPRHGVPPREDAPQPGPVSNGHVADASDSVEAGEDGGPATGTGPEVDDGEEFRRPGVWRQFTRLVGRGLRGGRRYK